MDCWGYLGRRCTGSHGIPSGTRYDCKGVIGVGGELTAESTALQQIGDDSKIGEQQPERRNCKRLCRPQKPSSEWRQSTACCFVHMPPHIHWGSLFTI